MLFSRKNNALFLRLKFNSQERKQVNYFISCFYLLKS